MSEIEEKIRKIEEIFGITLLSYQRILIGKMLMCEKIYLTMPPNIGRTANFEMLGRFLEVLNEEK